MVKGDVASTRRQKTRCKGSRAPLQYEEALKGFQTLAASCSAADDQLHDQRIASACAGSSELSRCIPFPMARPHSAKPRRGSRYKLLLIGSMIAPNELLCLSASRVHRSIFTCRQQAVWTVSGETPPALKAPLFAAHKRAVVEKAYIQAAPSGSTGKLFLEASFR